MWIARTGIVASSGGDLDALAFINAAGITDTTQKNAINQLVLDLKSANIWGKMKAIYPFVGGTASSHKFNLKDPRDLDAAYRLVFAGGWTHSTTGAKPNGTTTYADTKFNLSANLPNAVNSNHISVYIRDNIDEVKVDMGIIDSYFGNYFDVESRIGNTGYYGNLRAANAVSFSNTDSRGLHINTRTTSSLQKVFINTTLKGSDLNSTTGTLNGNIALASRYNLTNGLYEFRASKEQAFASIGEGLSDSEAAALYNAVNTFQVALSRNV